MSPRKRMGKTDGYYVRKVWRLMVEKGAIHPDGTPLTVSQILEMEGQPFSKNQLSQHLAKKKSVFAKAGTVRIRQKWGTETQSYRVSTWLAHADAYDEQDDEEE